jgi:tetratricopeptide (TPR) repeat protein
MTENAAVPIISNRYILHDRLGTGGMGSVYRATDRLNRNEVALKHVTTSPADLMFASRDADSNLPLALAQEFKMLASLRHPQIISVLDYGFDARRQPYFTMEYLPDTQTIVEAAQDKTTDEKVMLLVQTLQALVYLHRRGVLHRDLKPGNILVSGDRLKVLDFGLSLVSQHTVDDITQTTAGTFAYMAPELFKGQRASRASDLYAAGVIAYEMFTGSYPYDRSNVGTLVAGILNSPIDLSATGLDDSLCEVLERLLTKDPAARYRRAGEVIRELCEAADLPLPPETAELRESFLQAATFVGRSAEMAQLEALLDAVIEGKGSAWLVGGESGVGKTRLLDELRARALVEGLHVLRGRGVAEGGRPYELWRDAMRWLCLQTDLSELEASVLKMLVPDISRLIEREVPDAPEIDPDATAERVMTVIEDVFLRQRQPMVLILEDLHWAAESLKVLARLSRNLEAEHMPLLILGNYRDDERPDLPDELPEIAVLKLERFTPEETTQLSAAMLGAAGREAHIVHLLQRDTEGNAFFVVEVLRALAEEAGGLDEIASMTLPAQVFAGGMRQIIERRLGRVPPEARPLLQMAAVAGRRLDLNILRALAPEGGDIDNWLAACADAAVLVVEEGHWQFAHDKLRDGLLVDLPEDRRIALHRQVAEALEATYPGAPEHLATLARHWGEAGDVEKEAHYTALAGEYALGTGAYGEAIFLLDRTLELRDQVAISQAQQASLERQLGDAHYGLGQLSESAAHFLKALALMGWPVPKKAPRLVIALLGQVAIQTLHRALPVVFSGRMQHKRETLQEGVLTFDRLGQISFAQGNTPLILFSGLRALNLAELIGPSPELARAFASNAIVVLQIPLRSLAERYLCIALDIIEREPDPTVEAWIGLVVGVIDTHLGRWDRGEEFLERGAALADVIGARRVRDENLSTLGYTLYHSEFRRSKQLWSEVYTTAHRRDDPQLQVWSLCGQASNTLRLGETGHIDEALEYLDRAEALLDRELVLPDEIRVYGLLAQTHLRNNQSEEALDNAREAIQRITTRGLAPIFHAFEGYAGVPEVALALWEAGDELHRELAKQGLKGLHAFSRIMLFAQPRTWMYQGLYEWLSGKPRKAHKAWQKSLSYGEQYDMPWEQGRTHFEIGRHLPVDDPARMEHLKAAEEIFERLGAQWDLERTREDLTKS